MQETEISVVLDAVSKAHVPWHHGARSFKEALPTLLVYGLWINIQACKQFEESFDCPNHTPTCGRGLVYNIGCLAVRKSAHEYFVGMPCRLEQAVSTFTIKCHNCGHSSWDWKQCMWDSEELQGISISQLYSVCHVILDIASRLCAQSCLDYRIYKWLQSCILCCCASFLCISEKSSTIAKLYQ